MSVYVSIGNSDDKLAQEEWAKFWERTDQDIRVNSSRIYGVWSSLPNAPYQNACWCFDPLYPEQLKPRLAALAARFGQDSIAWAEAQTEFIEAERAKEADRG